MSIIHNTSEVRQLLATAFDDVGLVSLCQDEFPDLAKVFARGMRKDEIINLIIDFFNRLDDFMPLMAAIKNREPDQYSKYEARILQSRLGDSKAPKKSKRVYPREDWGEAIDAQNFYGRQDEIELLEQWVSSERCRLVAVIGIGGIGKSSLTVKLAEKIKEDFEYFFWRDLRNGTPIDIVVDDCIKFLSDQIHVDIPDNLNNKLSILLDYLKKHKCLLILDNAETILQGGETIGAYRPGFEGYGQLIERIGNSPHKSCLIVTSREKLYEISFMERARARVKSLQLTGLDPQSAQKLIYDKGLQGSIEETDQLINLYGRNPLALNLAAAAISDWFGGQIADFLRDDLAVFGDIEDLIEQQLKRLPETGQEIMYWLAIQREIVSMSKLEKEILYWLVIWRDSFNDIHFEDVIRPITKVELIEILDSLRRRSLIEKINSHFALQPVVMEYLTKQFTKQIYSEIATEKIELLRSHALIQAQAKDHILQSQIRFILKPLTDRLLSTFGKEGVEKKLKQLLTKAQDISRVMPSYLGGNLINCLVQMSSDLTGYDFSNLAIWQANLKSTELHNVNFSNTDLTRTVFAETFDLILSVAFSPNGELVAAGSASGDIIVWEAMENRQILVLKGHTGWTRSVAFSPDSSLIASGSGDKTVRIWDIKTGDCKHILQDHTDWVRSVVFSPDGNMLASGGSDKVIRLWDIDLGNVIKKFEGHDDWVWSLCFNPDSTKLASASSDKSVRLWNVETGSEIGKLTGHTDWVTSVTFSEDGRLLATGSNDKTVCIWDANSKNKIKTLEGHSDRVWSVAFNSKANTLVSGSYDRTVRVWDVETGQKLKTLQGHNGMVISVAFSPDNNTVVSGSEDQTVRLWNIKTGDCLKTFQGHTNCIQSIDFSPDGQFLVSGSTDWTARLWDVNSSNSLRIYRGHTNRIQSVAVSKDGKTLASCGDDQTIRIWDIDLKAPTKVLKGHTSWIRSLAFNPDSTLLASASDDLTVRIWDVKSGQQIKTLIGYTSWFNTLCFSPDGQTLATGSADTTIKLWDIKDGKEIKTFLGNKLRVNSVVLEKSGRFIASGGDDGSVRLWDVESTNIFKAFEGHVGPVKSICFNLNGSQILSAGDDKDIRLWDIESGNVIKIFKGHASRVWSVKFALNDNMIASGSEDGTIRIWDASSGNCTRILVSKKIYEGLNITGAKGLTDVQKMNLVTLGARDNL